LVNAPPDFESELVPLPEGVHLTYEPRAEPQPYDVILAFFAERNTLHAHFGQLAERLKQNGGLWLCWIKKAAGIPTDLGEAEVRATGLAGGLVDNKGCAVTQTWSGLRFVYRLRDRT